MWLTLLYFPYRAPTLTVFSPKALLAFFESIGFGTLRVDYPPLRSPFDAPHRLWSPWSNQHWLQRLKIQISQGVPLICSVPIFDPIGSKLPGRELPHQLPVQLLCYQLSCFYRLWGRSTSTMLIRTPRQHLVHLRLLNYLVVPYSFSPFQLLLICHRKAYSLMSSCFRSMETESESIVTHLSDLDSDQSLYSA